MEVQQEISINGMVSPSPDANSEEYQTPSLFNLPYVSKASFLPLIKKVEEIAALKTPKGKAAKSLLKALESAPELFQPVDDHEAIKEHHGLIHWLMSYVLPEGFYEQQLVKISPPFSMDTLFVSPALVELEKGRDMTMAVSQSENMMSCIATIKACTYILEKLYDKKLNIDPPFKIKLHGNADGQVRFLKPEMKLDYVDIKVKGKLPKITDEQVEELLTYAYDTSKWVKVLPPEIFEFHGFVVMNFVDITEEESLSQIKHHLLKREAVLHKENITELEALLQIYLGVPDLQLGVTAIDFPLEYKVAHQYKIRFDILADEVADLLHPAFSGSIYERVCTYRNVMLIEDMQKIPRRTALEDKLISKGIGSMIVATLVGQDEHVIGLIELASPRPYALHSFVEMKFRDVVRLFHTAVQRSREEVDNTIEAIIREKYTALHTSVEWRFISSAFDVLQAREKGINLSEEEQAIVFKDVYPLYGQADIVSSSTKRNESIQADLTSQLNLAKDALERANTALALPIVSQSLLHLNREINHLEDNFNSNDETRIIDLLQSEIEPILKQLKKSNAAARPLVKTYFKRLDNELGVIYERRKDYEQSVETINETIGNYMEEQEVEMQNVLPHYFEKYKTDGVEYEMYVGSSLLQRQDHFSPIHLRNFRLTQLMQMCTITRKVEEMKQQLPEPLTTAQLVFVYTTPLSIRFRMDEKQFDVDGAYNVRYEILKKRIDKAVIEGTNNRLTRAGHVAIVYLHDKDRQEYLDYADYLLYEGYIAEPPEDLVLAPLQGVQGLKALRLKVKL